MIESSPTSNDRVAAILLHLAGIFFWVVPSLIVYVAVSGNPWLKEQARNALNFQITLIIGWIIAGVLTHILIGFFLFMVIEVLNVICSIIAALRANEGTAYKYPFTWELIKA